MQFIGIDIGSDRHHVARLSEQLEPLGPAAVFEENLAGYQRLRELLGEPQQCLIAMEATGHYWRNLFAFLSSEGYQVALLNPLRTRRHAEEEMRRAKTDRVDAAAIARFCAEKRPRPTILPDEVCQQLGQLVRMRDRLIQDFGDRVRQLHRLVDLCFPELRTHLRDLGSVRSTGILQHYPTAEAFRAASVRRLSHLRYDGKQKVGTELSRALIELAQRSVAAHQGAAYELEVRYVCEDLQRWRERIAKLDGDIEKTLQQHEVGVLLTSIDGIGPLTSARILAVTGDPARMRSGAALSSFIGVVPATALSGRSRQRRFNLSPLGHAKLRRALWMPTLTAVRKNPWLSAFYQRLIQNGKPHKVALTAAMRKLLLAVYSVAKHRRPFIPILPQEEGQNSLINA